MLLQNFDLLMGESEISRGTYVSLAYGVSVRGAVPSTCDEAKGGSTDPYSLLASCEMKINTRQ
jgi:hypothetical protein